MMAARPPLARPTQRAAPAGPAWRTWLAPALILVAGGIFLARLAGCGLLGWDTYPLILTSRIQSFGDLAHNLTQRLMHGLYPSEFYRPVVNFSFALDHGLWGMRPFGYHFMSTLLFAGCAAALLRLLRRLAGSAAWIAPLAGTLVFLLHPSHFEVIPVPSRRAEILSGMFMALSLSAQLAPRRLLNRGVSWLPASFALLAFLSKESAFVLPALTFLVVFLYAPLPEANQRAGHALRALRPHALALALALAARLAVLGTIGGHQTTTLAGSLNRLPYYFAAMLKWVLLPQEVMQQAPAAVWLLALLAAALAATALAFKGWRRAPRPRSARAAPEGERGPHPLRLGLAGGAWLFLIGFVYSIAAEMSPWYMLLPVMATAIICGSLAEALVRVLRFERGFPRMAASAAIALLAVLLIWQARYSALIHPYRQWRDATTVAGEFLDQTRAQLTQAPPGTVLEGPPIPTWVLPRPGEPVMPRIYGAAIFAEYTIQAWALLEFPGRRIDVKVAPETAHAKAAPDGVLLLLTKKLPGY